MGTPFSNFMSPYVPNSLPVPPRTACRQASHQRWYGWGMRQRSAVLPSRMNYTYATRPPMSPLYSTMRKSSTEALLKVCCGHSTNEHGNISSVRVPASPALPGETSTVRLTAALIPAVPAPLYGTDGFPHGQLHPLVDFLCENRLDEVDRLAAMLPD